MPAAGSAVDSGTRTCRIATARCRARSQGPLRAGSVGPKSATIGVPTAAAMCVGPVSPDTISDA